MAATATLTPSSIESFRSILRGEVLEPSNPSYDATRNRLERHDRPPSRPHRTLPECCRCRGVGEFRRANGLAIAIRSGGHNVAGYAVCDGGLMIDMSLMKDVRVAPGLDCAFVEGGATWADVDAATTPLGRATPGGLISATGVAGLTLSGGIGWLRGSHGLSVDNLLAADLVTADGRLIHADATQNPDLFWALRGGGGNFGVVTSFEFAAPDRAGADVVRSGLSRRARQRDHSLWRDFMQTAPDRLSGLAEFSTCQTIPHPEHARGRRPGARACL